MQMIQKFFIKFSSTQVGADDFGNKYYISKYFKNHLNQFRRYVIYKNGLDLSSPNPLWNSWVHYMITIEEMKNAKIQNWNKNYKENQTGTKKRYFPTAKSGDISLTQTYEAWKP